MSTSKGAPGARNKVRLSKCLVLNAVISIACLVAAESAGVRLDAWSVLGPGGGGTTIHPVISPHDAKVVVEGCDMTGAYITRNGGEAWRMFNLGSVVSAFAFDPKDASVIYAAAAALFRSEDGGKTWRLLWPDPARGTVKHGWGDHAETVYTSDDPSYPGGRDAAIQAVAVDDADPASLYMAIQSRRPGPPGTSSPEITAIIASRDRGRTWARLTEFPPERIFSIWVEGKAERVVHAVGETGLHEGIGSTWRHLDGPNGIRFASGSAGYDEASGRTIIYATAPLRAQGTSLTGGIFVSTDSGRSWQPSNGSLASAVGSRMGGDAWGPAGGSRPHLGPISSSARHGLAAYVGVRGLRETEDGKPFNGVARTDDGGRTWTIVHRESDRPAANFSASWIETRATEDGYSVWFDAPYDLAAAPADPLVCYVTDLFRTYRTLDGGRTWAQVNSAPAGSDRWKSRGLDVTTNYGILWDPFEPSHMFVPTTDIGLFLSEDGGMSWTGSSSGVPKPWRNTTYWMVFDPEVKNLVWGAFSGTHDLPRPKMFRRTNPSTFRGGVAVSTDGGRHWTPSNSGMAESAITHVLLDPRSPKGSRTLYATAFGRGVYKSTDNGRTWNLKNKGLAPDPRNQPFAWRLTQDPAGVLYLIVARRSERGRSGDADDGALYRSTDGAELWTQLPLPRGTNGPNAVTVDPRNPGRLYLSAWALATPGGDSGGGVFVSNDAGQTWKSTLSEAQHVYDVTIDAHNPDLMYACGFDQGVYRSEDRGESWKRIRGFNFKWGHRVVIDPSDSRSIFVTTFGGGVWRGPAAGDDASREDVIR